MSLDPLTAYLNDADARRSKSNHMVGIRLRGPGYHTTLPDRTWVHSTLESLDYANALLMAQRRIDAADTIAAVLDLQDTDPDSRTYGVWPWYLEEPLTRMSPPDWNWADFCGARLLVILKGFGADLPEPLVVRMRAAVRHAAEAIVRRDVGLDYTNIAIMGGTVVAAAGDLFADPRLIEYGRRRLQRMVEYTQEQGSFNEYNSPTYTMVALQECERVLHLVSDPPTREAAEWLRVHAWQVIAEHYHPATGQWAGPHSRTYSDRLPHETVYRLSERLHFDLPMYRETNRYFWRGFDPLPPIPCPPQWVERFRSLPEDPCLIRRRFVKRDDGDIIGTTWFDGDACLGSVNHGTFWTQSRPLLAYFATRHEPAVTLRVRFLHDDRDFASATVDCEQTDNRVAARVRFQPGLGDFHCHLDKPADGIFQASDLRLRLEMKGYGTQGEELGDGVYEFSSGWWTARIAVGSCHFMGAPVVWETWYSQGLRLLDGICYRGEQRGFGFPGLDDAQIDLEITLQRRSFEFTGTDLRRRRLNLDKQ